MRVHASAILLLTASACVATTGDDKLTSGPTPAPPTEATADAGPPDAADTADAADASSDAAAPSAEASITPPSYVLTPDTALDGTAHLMWQRNDPPKYFELVTGTGEAVTTYCSGLALGGFHDWRPATLAELTTLLVQQPDCPLLDHAAFPTALCDWYMSSDIINNDQYNSKMLDFATGVIKSQVVVGTNTAFSSRCVRTSP